MSETKTYHGGCHCGAVQYDVELDLGQVTACNCSLCSRMGWLLTFVPSDRFTLRSTESTLRDYQFNKKRVHHLFCERCGVRSFSRGEAPGGRMMVAINVRCLDGVDISALPVHHFDGKSL